MEQSPFGFRRRLSHRRKPEPKERPKGTIVGRAFRSAAEGTTESKFDGQSRRRATVSPRPVRPVGNSTSRSIRQCIATFILLETIQRVVVMMMTGAMWINFGADR